MTMPPSPTAAATTTNTISGYIFLEHGLPAAGLTARLYGTGFAGADTKIAEDKTDTNGFYTISYPASAGAGGIELRGLDAQGKEIVLSDVKYEPDANLTLNLVAPSTPQPLAAALSRLSAD